MATLTRLASTLTAKFSPSQTLTDAFYIDGRLCGKRETRQADITIEKEERGYFFSVFTHPTIEGFEPGMLPPFEPQFRSLCNDVKFGHKEIDSLIEKFLSTAVDVTGKMRLTDNEMRSPYFSGIIVKDAEAFAVTIGNGLAFLYRDDTLFPLTDAGIPMEAIDAFDNRVGDFMYYCASKTANALWSNYFTLSPDDCIILCNKAVYDALGQREILRILNEAEDQCDAAGVVITQASARMPNVPMQFSISFVENVTNTDKRGIFGFKKKSKDEGEENNVESVVEGGVVGAAAEAVSDAGFVALGAGEAAGAFAEAQKTADALAFGEKAADAIDVPKINQEATGDNGIEVGSTVEEPSEKIEFLDDSVSVKPAEVTPEDMLKNSLNEMKEASEAAKEEPEMETISVSEFNPETPTDDEPTKPVTNLDASIFAGLKEGSVLGQAIKDMSEKEEEPAIVFEEEKPEEKIEEKTEEVKAPEIVNKAEEIVFDAVDDGNKFFDVPTEESFNPYSAGDPEEMKNAAPLIFGDDASIKPEEVKVEEPEEEVNAIPVPEFEIDNPKPEIAEEDKLNVDFPETVKEEEVKEEEEPEKESEEFKLPFANDVETVGAPEAIEAVPAMPEYDANVYDTPVNAVNSEEPIDATPEDAYAYGEYEEPVAAPADNAFFAASTVQDDAPYQPYGSEVFAPEDQNQYRADDTQQVQTNAYSGYEQPVDANYADQTTASSSSSSGSTEDAWIMDLLGVDEGDYMRDEIPDGSASEFVAGGAQGGSPVVNERGESYSAGGAGPNGGGNQPPVRKSASGGRTGGGNGKSGGGKPKVHLNRNGYIFIAFVALLIICLIIMISLIVKACSNKETDETKTTQSSGGDAVIINPTDESGDNTSAQPDSSDPDQTQSPDATGNTDTTANTDNTQGNTDGDPSAPIASFQFSDYIGYRTWWDLFNYVYNIQLSDLSDKRIKIIKDYNRFPSDYTPNSGDIVLLPPPGVLDGSIPNTFIPGEAQPVTSESTASSEETANTVTGEPALITATP